MLKFKQWIRSVQSSPPKKLWNAPQLPRKPAVFSAKSSQTTRWWWPILSTRSTPSRKITFIWSNSTPSMTRWTKRTPQRKARRKSSCQGTTRGPAEFSCCSAWKTSMACIEKSQGFSTPLSRKYWLNVTIGSGCSNILKWLKFWASKWTVLISAHSS